MPLSTGMPSVAENVHSFTKKIKKKCNIYKVLWTLENSLMKVIFVIFTPCPIMLVWIIVSLYKIHPHQIHANQKELLNCLFEFVQKLWQCKVGVCQRNGFCDKVPKINIRFFLIWTGWTRKFILSLQQD